MQSIYLTIALAPLVAAIVAGLFGRVDRAGGAHTVTIAGVALSFGLSIYVLRAMLAEGMAPYNGTVYTLAGQRRRHDAGRVPDRPPVGDDDVRRDLRVADGAHLHRRLHARGPGLPALLQLHLAVHVRDADAGDVEQLHAAVLRLGGRRRRLVPADRLLVHAPDGDLREPQGIPRQPRRRLRLRARHCRGAALHGVAGLRDRVRACRPASRPA